MITLIWKIDIIEQGNPYLHSDGFAHLKAFSLQCVILKNTSRTNYVYLTLFPKEASQLGMSKNIKISTLKHCGYLKALTVQWMQLTVQVEPFQEKL